MNIRHNNKYLCKVYDIFFHRDFVTFVIIGSFTFALDYLLYIFFLHLKIPIDVAKASSSFMAVLVNYTLNSRYNFGKNNSTTLLLTVHYLALYTALIGIHVAINHVILTIITTNTTYAVLLAMTISVFINYYAVSLLFTKTTQNDLHTR